MAGELSPQFESDIKIKIVCRQWKVIFLTQLYCFIFFNLGVLNFYCWGGTLMRVGCE